jgi:oligopeptide/dipeptide ABC transporter, ATP-binding protein, C-terminal domain
MTEALLSVQDLQVKLFTEKGELPVLNHVSFDILPGEIVGIVGESGCGKSMLASSIMGLIDAPGKIIGGQILFEGRDITKLKRQQLQEIRGKDISTVFQEPMTSLNPLMKCGKQIEEAITAHEKLEKAEVKKRALKVIKEVGIPMPEKIYNEIPSHLSGGMRQRIMIAMALVCHPRLLICDEPTTALDVTIQAQILYLIRKLRDETGTSVIFISHDMGVISQMADRVVVMYAGEIVEKAEEAQLFAHPRHPYTIGLQNAIPQLSKDQERLQDIPGSVPMLDHLPQGCLFSPRCPYADDHCRKEKPQITVFDHQEVRCFNAGTGGIDHE